jgi:hypothetical protein
MTERTPDEIRKIRPRPTLEEVPVEVERFAPAKHQTEDPEAMSRAQLAYEKLTKQNIALKALLEASEANGIEKNLQIRALELQLAEQKTVASTYRQEADDAKAAVAAWRTLFSNMAALFARYDFDMPIGAPREKYPTPLPIPSMVPKGGGETMK